MNRFGPLQLVFGLMLIVCLPFKSAQALNSVSWVSVTNGDDSHSCDQSAPCRTFAQALNNTAPGGTISARDPGDYGGFVIQTSVTIVNDSGGTVTTCCDTFTSFPQSNVLILAEQTDIVTLHGLTLVNTTMPGISGIVVLNALQVNIENCTITGVGGEGIVVDPGGGVPAPFLILTSGPTLNVSIQDTFISNNGAGGIEVLSGGSMHVTTTIDRTRINNNGGAGIRADGSNGGAVTVAVSDSTINLNAGNGVLAVSGPGTTAVHVSRTNIASNASSGVQSNQTSGGAAIVTVRRSTLTNNANGAVNFFGGGTLQTFGDNNTVGPNGTGFTGPIALQ